MAYTHPNLHRIGPTNSDVPTLWMYSTTDTIATVIAADYFLDAEDDLNVNDVIIVASSTGGTPVLTITYINEAGNGVVDCVAGNTILATDAT